MKRDRLFLGALQTLVLGGLLACSAESDSVSLNNQAVELRDAGRYEEALEVIDQCLEGNEADAQARFNRGTILKHLGRYDEALAELDRSLQLEPEYAPGHLNRGRVLALLGRHEEALEAYDSATTHGSAKPAEVCFRRGEALAKLERYPEAEREYERALEIDPKHTRAESALDAMRTGDR